MKTSLTFKRSSCRLCDGTFIEKVIDFEATVPVDNYRPRFHNNINLARFAMDLYLCKSCGHAQLLDVVDPNILYGDYIYTSTSSPGLENHFNDLVDNELNNLEIGNKDFIVDIGCNDGLLLSIIKGKFKCKALGIDPSAAALNFAKKRGIDSLEAFISKEVAWKVLEQNGKAKLVTATNVFSHADNMTEFIQAIHILLENNGFFMFEVSYLKNLIFSSVWDYVYHEHLAHHSVKPLQRFLSNNGFKLIDVREIESKGGSIRCIAQKTDNANGLSETVAKKIIEEELLGLYDVNTYVKLRAIKRELRLITQRVINAQSKNSLIGSYGASATTTVLSKELGYDTRVNFIIDDNASRQMNLSPGLLIPVFSWDTATTLCPSLIIISAWRFKDAIVERCKKYLENGGLLYVPLPYPHLITIDGESYLPFIG